MPEFFEIPENAVGAYETLTRLRITVHDRTHTLARFLPPDRSSHRIAWCDAAKQALGDEPCRRFAVERIPHDLARAPEGRVHVCHAGLVECVVPVEPEEGKHCILFAGVRLPGARLTCAERFDAGRRRVASRGTTARLPPPIDDAEALVALEGLRQLAARLRAWLDEWRRLVRTPLDEESLSRGMRIRRFVQSRYADPVSLADLARALHLSESRASHAVREACGKTFVELLTEERIRSAANLLRASDLPVGEVAYRTGFGDIAHFHRTFRRCLGTTPRIYRTTAETTRGRA